ncbi:hypothetical protein pipiens_013028 [Culex pipiens pipiens]|uniref:Uncharacterized protein n=1 Tax=Culex pipiens pipiens TaxID=38569 RepID=A0ABD1D013_CULPP
MVLADVCELSSCSLLAGGPVDYQSFQRDIALGSQNLENSLLLAVPLGFRCQGGGGYSGGGFLCHRRSVHRFADDEVVDNLLETLAVSAADFVYWDRVLAMECQIYELLNKERISVTTPIRSIGGKILGSTKPERVRRMQVQQIKMMASTKSDQTGAIPKE